MCNHALIKNNNNYKDTKKNVIKVAVLNNILY